MDNKKKIAKQNKETLFRRGGGGGEGGGGKGAVAKDCVLEQDTSDPLLGS